MWLVLSTPTEASNAGLKAWQDFRLIHPFGYQAVGLKHDGDKHIFIISEPSSYVNERDINGLFIRYGGDLQVVKHPIGHDGWLCDLVGEVSFNGDDNSFNQFSKSLFTLLFGTDYKSYYIDLDNPEEHVFYSSHRLNYSVSAAELEQWFVKDNEALSGQNGNINLHTLLSGTIPDDNALLYSQDNSFVVWALNKETGFNNDLFRTNARKFAIDADLVIGALGTQGGNFAIIARKRQVPLNELPPLRAETLALLMDTSNEHLAQSYERHAVFAGKQKDNWDVAPIYLSSELKHTEYGILLNNTDQMLKSWSENGAISYQNFSYPTPVFWGFNIGAYHDLEVNTLTYNWNTSGAGYVIQNDGDFDIYAINRTGCLPVSFIPSGMEGKIDQKVNDAEELAYDFFSDLQNVDLVRVVQYAAIYQIASHFKPTKTEVKTDIDYAEYHSLGSMFSGLITPPRIKIDSSLFRDALLYSRLSYRESISGSDDDDFFVKVIADLLKHVDTGDGITVDRGFERYLARARENGPRITLSKLKEKDPYGGFAEYAERLGDTLSFDRSDDSLREEYYAILNPHVDSVKNYIERYKFLYNDFPYEEASRFLYDRNAATNEIRALQERRGAIAEEFIREEEELNSRIEAFNESVREYNTAVEAGKSEVNGTSLLTKSVLLKMDQDSIERQSDYLYKKMVPKIKSAIESIDSEINRILFLFPDESVQLAIGALNWLWTDPAEYDAPIGDYYASHFNSHRTWVKTPSIVQSTNLRDLSAYGGHNLDAHITPIKVSKQASRSIPKGYCQVTVENGNRIINVSSADKSRLTPATLRTIERKAIEGTFRLPDAPPVRAKSYLKDNSTAWVADKTATIGETRMTDVELMEQVSKGLIQDGVSPVKEIRFSGYDARRVRAFADNLQDCIIERSVESNLSLKNFDINEGIEVITGGDGNARIIIKQRPSTITVEKCTDAELILTVPADEAPAIKNSLIKIYSKPSEQIDNPFKWKRQLRLELEATHPEFNYYDIIDEYHQVYSFIFYNNYRSNGFEFSISESPVFDFFA